jgi:hypothetical protein
VSGYDLGVQQLRGSWSDRRKPSGHRSDSGPGWFCHTRLVHPGMCLSPTLSTSDAPTTSRNQSSPSRWPPRAQVTACRFQTSVVRSGPLHPDPWSGACVG